MKKSNFRVEQELQDLTNQEVNKESEELIKRSEIDDSPFVVITTEEGSFVTMGKFRLSEPFKTEDEAINYIGTWNFMFNVMVTLINQITEHKNN